MVHEYTLLYKTKYIPFPSESRSHRAYCRFCDYIGVLLTYWTPTYIRSTPNYYIRLLLITLDYILDSYLYQIDSYLYIRLLLTYWSSTYISDSYLYITITNTTEFSQHGKLPTAARLVLLSSLYFLFTSFIDLALLHLQSLSLQELHHLHLQTSHLQAPCSKLLILYQGFLLL